MNSQEPDLIISVPLPHVDITSADLQKTIQEFRSININLNMRGEQNYPVSHTWAEIAILAAALSPVALSHYSEKLFDALDRFLVKGVKSINLAIRYRDKLTYNMVPRDDRAAAIAKIEKALAEIHESLADIKKGDGEG